MLASYLAYGDLVVGALGFGEQMLIAAVEKLHGHDQMGEQVKFMHRNKWNYIR
jgi:hypothetical protein